MPFGTAWWILFVLWFVLDGGVRTSPYFANYWYGPWFLFALLIGMLGWHDFGFIVH
jgi:hypothetical protein